MSDELEKVENPTPSTEEIKPTESTSVEAEGQPNPDEGQETVDYAALYEEEKSRREKAEHKIVKMRAKELEPEADETEPEDLKSYIDQKFSKLEVLTQEQKYEQAIDKVSKDDAEKKLIKFHLENNSFAGDIEEQVLKAKALANYRKLATTAKELAHARSVQAGGEDSSSHRPKSPKQVYGLSEADVAFLKKRGIYEDYIKKYGK